MDHRQHRSSASAIVTDRAWRVSRVGVSARRAHVPGPRGRAFAFLLAGVLASGAGAQGTLVVLNKGEASASVIDRDSGAERARIETGVGPHEVAISPDGTLGVVADYGAQVAGNTLSLLDLRSRERIGVIDLGRHARPHGIVFLPDARRVLVTSEQSRRLLIVDVVDRGIVGEIDTAAQASHMVALSPDGTRAFVANIGSGSVTAIDVGEKRVLKQIPTGAGAEGIGVSPDGREVWVTNRSDDTLSVIDAQSLEVVATLTCGVFPIRCAFTPDGAHVLVSCARSGEVAVFDAMPREQTRRIPMRLEPKAGEDRFFGDAFGDSPVPIGILIPPDGRHAYVANAQADKVAVIDLETWQVTGVVIAGREPDGMAWSALEAPDAPGAG